MSHDLPPAELPRLSDAEPQKLPYRRPELRDLGALAELTQAGSGPLSNYDGSSYTNS